MTRVAPNLVVAVIDSGMNLSHPDRKDRAWKYRSTAGDFYHNDNALHDSSYDRHGTHVAGIAPRLDKLKRQVPRV